jgi:putative ABC transport system permease protein
LLRFKRVLVKSRSVLSKDRLKEERFEHPFLRVERVGRNLRFSLRKLRKNPGLSLMIVLTLALGVGANAAMFSICYAVFLAPLPYPHPDQLVVLQSKVQGHDDWVSTLDFLDWKQQNTLFQDLNAWTGGGFNIATQAEPENIAASHVTVGFYPMMGDRFYLGRNFLPDEGTAGKDHVVILTHAMWERLGGDPFIVGTVLHMDGEPYVVVGVLSAGVRDRGSPVIVPLVFNSEQFNRDYHWMNVIGRLKPGISVRQAQANMDAIVTRIARAHPEAKGWTVSVEPYKGASLHAHQKLTLWLLMGAVAFVLVIACVNVASLLLAKAMTEQREVGIRGALGASPAAIFAEFLTESLLLALFACGLSTAGGYAMLRGLIAVMPAGTLPAEADVRLNLPVLLFTLGIAIAAGLLFGCIPAWYTSRLDPGETLKEAGRSGAGLGRHRLRRLLVVGEFSLALALLAGAGLAIHSFWNLVHVDLGVRTDRVLTFVLGVPDSRSKQPERIIAYYRQILARIESVPGVSDATVMSGMPLQVPGFSMPFAIAGKLSDTELHPAASVQQVTPSYYRTFGINLTRGRGFTEHDNASSMKVAIVNEEFVRHFLRGTDPLRQRLIMQQFIPGITGLGPAVEWQIVGVYRTVRSAGLRESVAEIDIPFWQSPWNSASIGVRTVQDPESMFRSVAVAVHAVDPQIGLAEPRTMEQVRDEVLASDRFTMFLIACFALVALMLAGVGIYGVMAFSVTQRTQEMALRIALGATPSRLVALVMKEGIMLASLGFALGLIGALLVQRTMQSTLYGIGAIDFDSLGAVVFLLFVAALLACYLPAYRASSADPMQTLRNQ